MPHFYFDVADGEHITRDDESHAGPRLRSITAVSPIAVHCSTPSASGSSRLVSAGGLDA